MNGFPSPAMAYISTYSFPQPISSLSTTLLFGDTGISNDSAKKNIFERPLKIDSI
jgi:hypothetical protein